MTFASMGPTISKRLTAQLVGLSVDGLYSHIAWLRTIKDKIEYKGMKDVEVKFPLIEDITMQVAKLYGMIQPGERSNFLLSERYFSSIRRIKFARFYTTRCHLVATSNEIKRILIGLQTTDNFGVALPADWRPR